jgi:hypothetical protein
VHDSGVPLQSEPAEEDTTAELANVPNRPKTKPETAVAAISVIAMRMTDARTGEMPLLLPRGPHFIAWLFGSISAISHCGVEIRSCELPRYRLAERPTIARPVGRPVTVSNAGLGVVA